MEETLKSAGEEAVTMREEYRQASLAGKIFMVVSVVLLVLLAYIVLVAVAMYNGIDPSHAG